MQKVLILTGRYLPGYRDGGPVRSLINLTEWFGDEADFRIMCLDRDHGDNRPYPDISEDEYNNVGKAKVWYTRSFSEEKIKGLAEDADVVYVCGPYNDYARQAMRLKKEGTIASPLYVASMGSFSPGAFRIKGIKKRAYILYMKAAGMFDNVTWSVTSKREEEELKSIIGKGSRTVIASDLPRKGITVHTHVKEAGTLKLVFISRISRKKNLSEMPEILKLTGADVVVSLDVYGTIEDPAYFEECKKKLDDLTKNHPGFSWEYKGEAQSEEVPHLFAGYDAFLFPTLGENYGHVIAESLASGCVPVISDTTPWLDLNEKGCGFVCRHDNRQMFADALMKLCRMNAVEYEKMTGRCTDYITSVNKASVEESGYRDIFIKIH